MQEMIQQPQYQSISGDKCVMLVQYCLDGTNPIVARIFKKYVTFQTRQGSINNLYEFKNVCSDVDRHCIESVWTNYQWFIRHGQFKGQIPLKDLTLGADTKKGMHILV